MANLIFHSFVHRHVLTLSHQLAISLPGVDWIELVRKKRYGGDSVLWHEHARHPHALSEILAACPLKEYIKSSAVLPCQHTSTWLQLSYPASAAQIMLSQPGEHQYNPEGVPRLYDQSGVCIITSVDLDGFLHSTSSRIYFRWIQPEFLNAIHTLAHVSNYIAIIKIKILP